MERLAPHLIDPAEALSLARTALDDPGYFPPETFGALSGTHTPEEYAIDRIDDALRILRDDHEPDELVAAVSYYGQRLAAIAEELRNGAETDDQVFAADRIDDGLDVIDEAISALAEDDTEEA